MSPFYTGAVLRPRDRPGHLNPVPAPPDPRERIGAALSGISAELAQLPWDWPPDREPRPSKLLLRDQLRLNALRAERDRLFERFLAMPVYVESRSDARA